MKSSKRELPEDASIKAVYQRLRDYTFFSGAPDEIHTGLLKTTDKRWPYYWVMWHGKELSRDTIILSCATSRNQHIATRAADYLDTSLLNLGDAITEASRRRGIDPKNLDFSTWSQLVRRFLPSLDKNKIMTAGDPEARLLPKEYAPELIASVFHQVMRIELPVMRRAVICASNAGRDFDRLLMHMERLCERNRRDFLPKRTVANNFRFSKDEQEKIEAFDQHMQNIHDAIGNNQMRDRFKELHAALIGLQQRMESLSAINTYAMPKPSSSIIDSESGAVLNHSAGESLKQEQIRLEAEIVSLREAVFSSIDTLLAGKQEITTRYGRAIGVNAMPFLAREYNSRIAAVWKHLEECRTDVRATCEASRNGTSRHL